MDDLIGISRFVEAVGVFIVAIEIAIAISIFSTLMYIFLKHKAKSPKALFCTNCGTQLHSPSHYCVECGSKQ